MDEARLEALERRVEALTKTVAELSARLDAGAAPVAAAPAAAVEAVEAEGASPQPAKPASTELLSSSVSLVGRSFLVIGGAFLIRALTDRDVVPHEVGVGLGWAFAALWIVLGWRAAKRDLQLSASFHLGCAALTGFPLIVETSTRLGLVTVPWASALLVAFSGLLLAEAWSTRRRLGAWLGVGGGVAVATLLFQRSDAPVAPTLALLALGAGSLWLAESRGWTGPRWLVAPVLDFVVLRRVFSTSGRAEWADQLPAAMALALVAVAIYLVALAWRAWVRVRNVNLFEVVQTGLVVTVGVAVAARVEATHGLVTLVLALVALLLAGAAVVTTAKAADRADHGIDVWFYGALALGLVLAGGLLLTRGPLVTVLWSGLALALAALGRRLRAVMLWVFCGVLAGAVAVAGGVVALVGAAFVAEPTQAVTVPLFTVALVAVLLACWGTTAWRMPDVRGPRIAAAALLVLALLGVSALVLSAVRSVASLSDPALVVLVRTLVLVGGALLLAAARRVGPAELGWVAWLALGLAGVKLLVQDLPTSRASTLFISFLAFGLAIIVLPRLIRARNVGTS